MTQLSEHPSVKRFYEARTNLDEMPKDRVPDAACLRQLCLNASADDVGFIEHDRLEMDDQKAKIEEVSFHREKVHRCRLLLLGLSE